MPSTKNSFRANSLTFLLAGLLASGCSDGDTQAPAAGTVTLSGTAATGAAFVGTVTATDSQGAVYGPATIESNGTYAITVADEPPFILKATSSGGGETLYSYAGSGQLVANITELTTLAVHETIQASGLSLEQIYTQWESQDITSAEIHAGMQSVCDSLTVYLAAEGIPTRNCAILSGEFEPNGDGIDYVMDQIDVQVNGNSVSVTGPNGGVLDISPAEDASAIRVDVPADAMWELGVEVSVDGDSAATLPAEALAALNTYVPEPPVSQADLQVIFSATDVSFSTENAEGSATYTFAVEGDLSNAGDQIIGTVEGSVDVSGPSETVISRTFMIRYTWTRL